MTVREARPDDIPVLLEFWEGLRRTTGAPSYAPSPSEKQALAWLERVTIDRNIKVVVAEFDEDVAGSVVLSREPILPLVQASCVQVSYLYVRPGFERRGVGKALMAAAVPFADALAVDHVMTSAQPASREVHRFLARLGFSPLVTSRVAPVSLLRRRLSSHGPHQRVDMLLARRRSTLRRRAAAQGAGPGVA